MPRNYIRAIGKRPYAYYTEEQLRKALLAVHEGQTIRWAAEQYGVPRSTICRHIHDKNTGKFGRPPVFNESEEKTLAECISLSGDWGFPLTKLDIRLIVKAHLDRKGFTEPRFKNNFPGSDWTECFLKRHKGKLTERLSQNIKRSRAAVDEVAINEYFDELQSSLQDVEPELIINYDETNLTDDPKRKRVIVRRSCRHPEKILDNSKSSTSVMFSGTGSGHLLPVYINYKAENMYSTWRSGGPPGAKYNRTKSGWFTMEIFEDWFKTIILPYFRKFDQEKPKVLIGDNLASHVSKWVIEKCVEKNIRFILLPPNSTGLCQPMDVAFFKPLKTKWSRVLSEWKMKNRGVIPKDTFPRLLKNCLEEMSDKTADNVLAGFKGSGLVPLNRQEVLKRLPQTKSTTSAENSQEWVASFKEFLQETRAKETKPIRNMKKKKLNVKPGASVGNYDLEENEDANENRQKNKKTKKRSTQESDSDSSATISLHDSDDDIDFIDFDDNDEDNFAYEDISILQPFASDPLKNNPTSNSIDIAENMPSTSKQALQENMPSTSKQGLLENIPSVTKQSPSENGDQLRDSRLDTDKPKNVNLDSSTIDNIITVGDFVIVRFLYDVKAKKTVEKRFIGQVEDVVEESHALVKFMRKSQKAENTFVFPQVDDTQLVRPEDVVLKVVPLNVSRGRHHFPKFIKKYSCS